MRNYNRSPEFEYKVTLKFPENENGQCLVEVYVSANTAEEAELLATEENGGEAVDCIYVGRV